MNASMILTKKVMDANPVLRIIGFTIGEYGIEKLIGDDGIQYGSPHGDPSSDDLIEGMVPARRWAEWRTGDGFREELSRNGDIWAPMFGIRGWVCQYCGLGHSVMVRREYWKDFEEERSGLQRGELYCSFPEIMVRVLNKK